MHEQIVQFYKKILRIKFFFNVVYELHRNCNFLMQNLVLDEMDPTRDTKQNKVSLESWVM